MVDGSIRIGTKMDISGIKKDIKELEKEISKAEKEIEAIENKKITTTKKDEATIDKDRGLHTREAQEAWKRQVKAVQELEKEQEKIIKQQEEYRQKLDATKARLLESAAVFNSSQQLDKAMSDKKFGDSIKTQEQYNSLLEKTKADMQFIEQEAEKIATANGQSKEKILGANENYQKMLDTMRILTSMPQNFAPPEEDFRGANAELNQAIADNDFASRITSQSEYNAILADTQSRMQMIEAEAERIASTQGKSKEKLLEQNAEYGKLSHKLAVLTDRTYEFGEKSKNSFKKAKKEANSFGSAIKSGIKKLGKMGLAILGIRGVYGAVRTAMSEYMATNEQMAGQLATLKAGFGQILGPAIEWVVNLLFKAVGAVNSFVYALTGINFAAKANEAALKKQAKATGAAAKAANQLAGFDEQTKLSDTTGSGSSSNPVSLIDSTVGALSGFAEKLKNQILEGDWYGAGATAGEALMDGMESVDWHNIGSTIGETIGNAVTFVLGFVLNLDPLVILGAAVELVSGLIDGISEAIQNVDWMEVGGDLVELLVKGLIVCLILTNPFATLIALIFTPQGKELTASASELVGSIIGALVAAIVGAGKKIGEIGMEIWNGIKGWFDEYVDWEGTPGDIIQGLFNGIVDALKGVGEWIYNDIWVPFRDGFKKAFGINSPSKKMAEFGVNIIDGLCNGITGAIDKVKQACTDIWNAIKEKFANVGTWFKEKFSGAWEKVKEVFSNGEGGTIFDGIKEGISETFKGIVNKLIGGINTVIRVPFDKINGMLNTIRSISVLGVEPFKGLWSYNPLSIPQIPKLALGGIVNRPGRGVPAIIGEAGAEAVLPLENNTEWMDILADKIGGGTITIPITLDGKKIATYVVDIQKKKAFAMNGA